MAHCGIEITLHAASDRLQNLSPCRETALNVGTIDPEAVPFQNLEMGPLLGKGGYGKVYRALRDGTPLAVKVQLAPSACYIRSNDCKGFDRHSYQTFLSHG